MNRLAVVAVAFVIGALGGYALTAGAATTTDNPWTYQMTGPGDGLIVRANDGDNSQVLEVFDYLSQPIFGVNKAGGAWVAGDNFSVFPGFDIFNPQVKLSPDDPPQTCQRAGQLWIGGSAGRVWRCTGFYGARLWFPMTWAP